MSHVDEGTLHAWLDRPRSGLSDGDAAAIESHLAACSACAALLDRARSDRDAVQAILASGGRVGGEAPDFDELIGRRPAGPAPMGWRPRTGVLLLWAASFTIAVGLGWLTRDLLQPRQIAFTEAPEAASSTESRGIAAGGADAAPGGTFPPAAATEADASASAPGLGVAEQEARTAASQRPTVDALLERSAVSGGDVGGAAGARLDVRGDVAIGNQVQQVDGARTASPDAEQLQPTAMAAVAAPPAAPAVSPPPAPSLDRSLRGPQPSPDATTPGAIAADRAEPRVIRGRVTDPSGAPLPGVQLSSAELGRATVSGVDGSFSMPLEGAAAGSVVTIAAQRIGYDREEIALRPARGDTVAAISLRPAQLAFQEIVATGAANVDSSAGGGRRSSSPFQAATPAPFSWRPVDRPTAERLLGRDLPVVDDLEVVRIESADGRGLPLRVVQQTGSGEPITVTIDRIDPGALPPPVGSGVASALRGDLHVTVSGMLPVRDLEALLRRVR